MTQLFDTTTYEDPADMAQATGTIDPNDPARHLRSMPTGDDSVVRSSQWRLDDRTIEVGRKGIQAARQALQEAARAAGEPKAPRRAA